LDVYASRVETMLEANVISYYGPISNVFLKQFRNFFEISVDKRGDKKTDTLIIVLTTPGGSAQAVEKMVEIIRHHYNKVYFVVPDQAMSAGTIFCMAGDKIFMDYTSSLGPIDPQVPIRNSNGMETWVPALGYLDKYEELIEKAKAGALTDPEFAMLTNFNLAELRSFQQARDLTVSLLKDWLVKYKFKDWTHHKTHGIGKRVTTKQKEARAEEIAKKLGDNKIWHSHGRMLGIGTLTNVLRLEIEDYTTQIDLRSAIRQYNDLLGEYVFDQHRTVYMHSSVYAS
jgi:membrane-bound ClpP family serine protease